MPRNSKPRAWESYLLYGLAAGLGVTTLLIYNQLTAADKTLGDVAALVLHIYRNQLILLIFTIVAAISLAYFFQKSHHQREKTVNFTKRVSLDEYEKNKKATTEQAVKQLLESDRYKKYLEDKKNNRIREVELSGDDKIVLSDDSSTDD